MNKPQRVYQFDGPYVNKLTLYRSTDRVVDAVIALFTKLDHKPERIKFYVDGKLFKSFSVKTIPQLYTKLKTYIRKNRSVSIVRDESSYEYTITPVEVN